jgi:hypothetical protein
MGILLGYLAAVACGIVVDVIWFPGRGHKITAGKAMSALTPKDSFAFVYGAFC